jgi:hypothetical protein
MTRRIVSALFIAAVATGIAASGFSAWSSVLLIERAQSGGNLKCLGTRLQLYAENHGGRLPPLESPEAARAALDRNILGSKEYWNVPGRVGIRYQTNITLSGRPLKSVPSDTILLYEPQERFRNLGRQVTLANGINRLISSQEWPGWALKSGISLRPEPPAPEFWYPKAVTLCLTLAGELALLGSALWLAQKFTAGRKRA